MKQKPQDTRMGPEQAVVFISMLSLLCLLISGCGFTPLHASGSFAKGGQSGIPFEQIYIANIPDQEGQALRNMLIDRFYRQPPDPGALYRLDIKPVEENLIDLDVTKTADATRAQLRLATTLQLISRETNETLITRNLRAITSYNILANEFATRVSEQNARENALKNLARQIERHVALHFKR